MAERHAAIVDLLNPALPTWDLCCDHGEIGYAALRQYPSMKVVFVDRAAHTIDRLESLLASRPRVAGRYRTLCADVLQMELPATPVNFVVAGVSTEVICQFLSRLLGRRGDRVVCNTFQDATRFEARVLGLGLTIDRSGDVGTPSGRLQRVWQVSVPSGASRADRSDDL